jgi:hypothetical protein
LQQRLGHREQQHSRGSNSRLLQAAFSTQKACPARHLSILYWPVLGLQLQLERWFSQQLLLASQVVLLVVLLG